VFGSVHGAREFINTRINIGGERNPCLPLLIGESRAGYLVAALVWGIGLSLGGTTGYAINPARDFGPRLAHAVLPVADKGPSDWGYAVVPILGPLIGGGLGGLLLRAVATSS